MSTYATLEPTGTAAPSTGWTVTLLDGFALHRGAERVDVPLAAQRLLALLAVHGRPLPRSLVAGTLWPDKSEERAHANLRSILWRLRRLSPARLVSGARCLALVDDATVDVHRVTAAARAQLDGDGPTLTADARALVDSDELLPGWYDDWVLVERERLRQLRLHALERLCARLTTLGRIGEAVDVGLAIVAHEPLRESAHRALIGAHLAEGNVAEAVRQYARCRAALWDALELEPGPELEHLVSPWRDAGSTWPPAMSP
jgi:DNA-binding SARP family transcriptional activator